MENSKYQGEVDREIRKIESAISKLQVRIHQKKRELVTLRQGNEATISRCHAKIKLKKEQIAALEKRPQPQTTIREDTEMNEDPIEPQDLETDIENRLLVTLHGVEKARTLLGGDFKKLVVWQIERHIQWTSSEKQRPWTTTAELCSILDIRTAAELAQDVPMGQGNLKLNPKYCRLPLRETPWGPPAAALLDHANNAYIDPEEWILMDEPRALLIAVENWYFSLPEEKRAKFVDDLDDKRGMPLSIQKKWDRAFEIGSLDSATEQTGAESE